MVGLADLMPKPASFVVAGQGQAKKILCVRPFTLGDDAWLAQNFSDEELSTMFETNDPTNFCKVLWHMMDAKSQQAVAESVKVEVYNEETKEKEIKQISGHEKLMHLMASSAENKISAMQALQVARGVSQAVIDELEGTKKKKQQPILAKFLTWLLPNTGGR